MKYNKKSELLKVYNIPSSVGYDHRLDLGEWTFPIHESVLQEVSKFNQLCRYGSIDAEFTSLLHEIKQYTKINSDGILITNGSDNALRLILDLFATDQSTFLVPKPSYNNFELMLETHDVKHVSTPQIDHTLTNEEVYLKLMQELTLNYDVCYLINPSMLIGHLLTHDQIEHLLKTYPSTLFIIDEAYVEFSNQESCAPFIEKYSNLIVVKTFSKFFSLASLRIGYLLTNPTLLNLIKPYYNYRDISPLAVKCALATLKNLDFYKKNKETYFEIKQYLKEQLTKLNKSNLDFILNDGVYFVILCKDPLHLQEYLKQNGVSVRSKHSDLKGSVRITISTYESMKKVVDLLSVYC
jgi:histidinol-phosphate aminotransferase